MALTKITLTGASETIKAGMTKVNDIIDDLAATTSGLGASCVGILDAGDYMSSANVEDALQEIYADTAATRLLVDAFGENSSTTTGLTWGWNAGTIRYDNTVTTVAAGTLSLTDDATNYVECDTAGSVSRNTTGFTAGRYPMRTVVCASGVQTTSTDSRSYFSIFTIPLPVTKGGTGLATITDHGIMLGSGTGAVTPLGAATNGQLPIGSTGADPVLAEITATANETTVANGAGTITIGIADDVIIPTTITVPNTGLHILDSNASHDLIIKPGSDLSADRELTITTGDAARTVTLSGNLTVSGDTTISTFGATLTDDTDVATARATLAVPAAVDFRNYLAGLGLSNAADTEHDITIAVGTCRDSTNAYTLTLASAMTKQIDAVWAAGTNAGGMFTGSVANSTFYYPILIRKDSDGTIDWGYDTSPVGANRPAGYTYWRRIGALLTDSSANILNGTWDGDRFVYLQRVNDRNYAAAANGNRNLFAMSVPPNMVGIFNIMMASSSGSTYASVGPSTDVDIAPTSYDDSHYTVGTPWMVSDREIKVNASSQIYVRASSTNFGFRIMTFGWIDTRGRDS